MLKQLKFALVLAVSTVSFSARAEAVEILFNNSLQKDYVVGINDIKINQIRYDVQFEFGTFIDVLGDPSANSFPPNSLPFWGSQEDTLAAVNSIVDALNTIPQSSACVLNEFQPYCPFFIPFAESEVVTAIAWAGGRTVFTNLQQYQTLAVQGTAEINRSYALIEEKKVEAVPEPSSFFSLLAVGAIATATALKNRHYS